MDLHIDMLFLNSINPKIHYSVKIVHHSFTIQSKHNFISKAAELLHRE